MELANKLANLLNCEIGIARIIVSEQVTHSKRFTLDLLDDLGNKNIVIADRDTIVCSNIVSDIIYNTGGHIAEKTDNNKVRNTKLRFHLGKGKHFMHWQISHTDNKNVYYYIPEYVQIEMLNCKLINSPSTAEKIYVGKTAKTPIAYVQCEKIEVDAIIKPVDPKERLTYNPKTAPNWFDTKGNNIDNFVFEKLVTFGRGVYYEAPDGKIFSLGGGIDYKGEHQAPSNDNAPLHNLTGTYPEDIYSSNAPRYYGDNGGDARDRESIRIIQQARNKPNKLIKIFRAVPDLNYDVNKELKNLTSILNYYNNWNFFPPKNELIYSLQDKYSIDNYSYDQQQELILQELKNQIDLKSNQQSKSIGINNNDWVTINREYAKEHGESHLNNKYKILSKQVKASELFTDGNSIHEFGYSTENSKFETGGGIPEYHLGGDMSKHLAPNGKPSNLTHEQWHLVRTPAFKQWFGFWDLFVSNKAKSYFDPEVRKIAKELKVENKSAISKAVKFLSQQVTENDVLIPMPSRTGKATDTQKLAEQLAITTGAKVFNCLVGKERDSIYEMKQNNQNVSKFDFNFQINCEIPKAKNYFIVDNVIGTGVSMKNALEKVIKEVGENVSPLVYAIDLNNISKVVDSNGEPLNVYHFSDVDFNIFEIKGSSNGFFFTENRKDDWFSYDGVIESLDKGILPRWLKDTSLSESEIRERMKETKYKTSKDYFLNIKKPNQSIVPDQSWSIPNFENARMLESKWDNYDGIYFINSVDKKRIIVAFNPEQIKLADGKNTTFDQNNPDIRFETGGAVQKTSPDKYENNLLQIRVIGGDYAYYTKVNQEWKFLSESEVLKLKEGAKHELEHTGTIQAFKRKDIPNEIVATFIAYDHINEDINYYKKLEKLIPEKMDKGGKIADYLSTRSQMFDDSSKTLTKAEVEKFAKLSKDSPNKFRVKDVTTGYSYYIFKGWLRKNDSTEGIYKTSSLSFSDLKDTNAFKIEEQELHQWEKDLDPDKKRTGWDLISYKFGEIYYTNSDETDEELVGSEVKAEKRLWQFDRYSPYPMRLSWSEAEEMFKKSLTKDQLNSIEISYTTDEYADIEEHDVEREYHNIIVKKKIAPIKENTKKTDMETNPIIFEETIDYKNNLFDLKIQSVKFEDGNTAYAGDVYWKEILIAGFPAIPNMKLEDLKDKMHKVVRETEINANSYSKNIVFINRRSYRVSDDTYYSTLQKTSKATLSKDSLRYFLENQQSAGMLASGTDLSKYDDLDALRSIMLKILREEEGIKNEYTIPYNFDELNSLKEQALIQFNKEKKNSPLKPLPKTIVEQSKESPIENINTKPMEKQETTPTGSVTKWNEAPVRWKNVKAVRPVTFSINPYDKGLLSIVSAFTGDDDLRPIMSAIHFEDKGLVCTDAHKLLHIHFKQSDFKGNYPSLDSAKAYGKNTSKEDIQKQLNEQKFPNWEAVIPKESTFTYEIDTMKLYQYCKVAINYANKTTNQIAFKFDKANRIGFNGKFLISSLETMMKIQKCPKLYIHLTEPSRSAILSFEKSISVTSSTYTLLMPVMLNRGAEKGDLDERGRELKIQQVYGASDIDYNKSISCYFDFSDNQIHNADGSIADYQESYGDSNEMPLSVVTMLDKFIKIGKTRLPILENVIVDGNGIRVDSLNARIEVANDWNLPQGLYIIQNNALISNTLNASFDDYPKLNNRVSLKEPLFTMDSDAFKFYIDKAFINVGTDDLRPVMSGFSFESSGSNLSLVSTNAITLLHANLTKYVKNLNSNFNIIAGEVKQLMNFAKNIDSKEISFYANERSFRIDAGRLHFEGLLVDGKYPNWKAIIPERFYNQLTFNIKDLYVCMNNEAYKLFVKSEGLKADDLGISNQGNKIFLSNKPDQSRGEEFISKEICEMKIEHISIDPPKATNPLQSFILLMPLQYTNGNYLNWAVEPLNKVISTIGKDKVVVEYTDLNRAYLFHSDNLNFNTSDVYKPVKPEAKILPKTKIAPIKTLERTPLVPKVKPPQSQFSNEKLLELWQKEIDTNGHLNTDKKKALFEMLKMRGVPIPPFKKSNEDAELKDAIRGLEAFIKTSNMSAKNPAKLQVEQAIKGLKALLK